GNQISIADVDAGAGNLTAAVSVSHGALTVAAGSEALITAGANNTATFTLTGTVAQINTALDGLVYTPTSNYNGAESLAIVVHDQGNTGSGGDLSDSETVGITVGSVNLGSETPASNIPATSTASPARGDGGEGQGSPPPDTTPPSDDGQPGFVGQPAGTSGPGIAAHATSVPPTDSSSWFGSQSGQYTVGDSGEISQGEVSTACDLESGPLALSTTDVLNGLEALGKGRQVEDAFSGCGMSPVEALQAAKLVLNNAIEDMNFDSTTKSVLQRVNEMMLDLVKLPPSREALTEAQICAGSLNDIVPTVFGGQASPLAQRMVADWINILRKIAEEMVAAGLDASQVLRQLSQVEQGISQSPAPPGGWPR
ncbi:MAG: hypothetical protein HY910_11900, partial [Desulfarculus sp.]|nr:hypothetical protein [Desulfarculus sp.]